MNPCWEGHAWLAGHAVFPETLQHEGEWKQKPLPGSEDVLDVALCFMIVQPKNSQ